MNDKTLVEKAIEAGNDSATISKLIDLQRESEELIKRKAFNAAFLDFQSKMPAISKAKSSRTAKYADHADIMKKARPILIANNLTMAFDQSETETTMTITLYLSHVDGYCQVSKFSLPKDEPIKSKAGNDVTNKAQAQGSANSYAKRYAVCNALDIVLIGEDDDAESLAGERITEEQAREIETLLNETNSDTEKFLSWVGCEALEEIPAAKRASIMRRLNEKKR